MPLDREKLIKFLGMTDSAHSGEALSAIRLANKLLKAAKMTWAEALATPAPVVKTFRFSFGDAEPDHTGWEDPPWLADKVQIDLMFRGVYSRPRTGNEDFWRIMDAMHESYHQHGRLTAAQYKVLRHAYGSRN